MTPESVGGSLRSSNHYGWRDGASPVAPSHGKSPTAAPRRHRLSYPSYHVLWPPAMVQSSSESPSLHLAVDVHGATGCVSRLKTSGHVARASACDCRPSYVCRPRQPLWTYAKPLSAIRHRLPSCWRRMACRLEQSQTLIPGRSRAASARMVAPQAAGWMYEAGKGLLQLYCVGWSTFASSFGCCGHAVLVGTMAWRCGRNQAR